MVTSQKLALGEVEESQGFPKVKQSKSQNGFVTIYSLDRDLFGTIFSIQSDEQKPKYCDLKILVDNQTGS